MRTSMHHVIHLIIKRNKSNCDNYCTLDIFANLFKKDISRSLELLAHMLRRLNDRAFGWAEI